MTLFVQSSSPPWRDLRGLRDRAGARPITRILVCMTIQETQ